MDPMTAANPVPMPGRPARQEDLAAVKRLVRAEGLTLDGLEDAFPGGFEVVEDAAGLAGVAGLEGRGRHGLLRSVVVRPDRRGCGLGRALVERRVREAERRGLEAVYLLTLSAETWFESLGFRRVLRDAVPAEVRASAEFGTSGCSGAAVMERTLGPSSASDAMLRDAVRAHYGAIARGADGARGDEDRNPVTADLYSPSELGGIPLGAAAASLGCGNPIALAELRSGDVALDLGSGGGLDVLLSARRVGPAGRAIGLDTTPEMLALARDHAREAGASNVDFLEGEMEAIPLPEGSVDVVVSNCVLNLSPDKRRAFGEAFRVLKPGGRLAISDVVLRRPLPVAVRERVEAWIGCVAGALTIERYDALLREVGFEAVEIVATRTFGREDLRTVATAAGCACGESAAESEGGDRRATDGCGAPAESPRAPDPAESEAAGAVSSAFVRARKPVAPPR
jgi:N-acetylglutamate synthase-like GNAT family acetyltransferase/SAM-dependent methyltransferase